MFLQTPDPLEAQPPSTSGDSSQARKWSPREERVFAQPLGSALALGFSCRESVLQPALGAFSRRPLCLSPRARGLRRLPYGLPKCMRGGATAGRSAPPGVVDSGPDGEPSPSQEGGRLLVEWSDRVAHKGGLPPKPPPLFILGKEPRKPAGSWLLSSPVCSSCT